jgi:AcrR family transcriptional regulator
MRSSSLPDILDAAMRVLDAADGGDITYDSVAREAGLTKAGLMYHFPSKDAMMIAIIEHVIGRWQSELRTALGVPLEQSTLEQRVRAFVEFTGTGGATPGEFAVFSEAVRRPALSAPWLEYLKTWFGVGDGSLPDATPLLLVWLAANGLWIAESTGILTVDRSGREALVAALLAILPKEDDR